MPRKIEKSVYSREAAFFALLAAHREECYISAFLEDWRKKYSPSLKDFHFAKEVSLGCMRHLLSLDYLASTLPVHHRLKLKSKERVLLRMALYQYFYLDTIPLYALVDEMVALAHRHTHPRFAAFLNAVLRKLPEVPFALPSDWSFRFSYPKIFIRELMDEYGDGAAQEILEVMNHPAPVMVRSRSDFSMKTISGIEVEHFASLSTHYIQNCTPVKLFLSLGKQCIRPRKILDLCAAPGGKLLLLRDFYPEAELWANDFSQQRSERLRENCIKYGLKATITSYEAENYPEQEKFDLILIDAPCSNTGVLHRKPEARWRTAALEPLQLSLIEKAKKLLSSHGQIWYMTCSILQRENEGVVEKACVQFSLNILGAPFKILPNRDGADGGFACSLV